MPEIDTKLGGVLSLCITFLFLTTASTTLRLLARRQQKSTFQVDDWVVVTAWIFFVGLNALMFYGYKEPLEKAIANAEHPTVVKIFLVLDALGIITLGLVKLSALFFYRRIFCSTGLRDSFYFVSGILVVAVVIWTIIFFVLTFNFCIGHSLAYNFPVGNTAHCKLIYPWFEASTTSDFGLDVLILALPLPKIWSLNATTSRKFAISGVFLLALVGLAASLARMIFLVHIVQTGRAINSLDSYQSNTQTAYFLILETGMTILAVNMPSLWYFRAGVTPDHVLRSVRSLVSLASGRSFADGTSLKGNKTSTRKESRDTNAARSIDTTCSRSEVLAFSSNSATDKVPLEERPSTASPRDHETFLGQSEHLRLKEIV